ncbi:MAG: hypothetical protein Q7Q73_03355 [Verrucomicrobiota bacterium JB024]|nr:hypothetical protein [Verrucomicrobiota bacterium JB024]
MDEEVEYALDDDETPVIATAELSRDGDEFHGVCKLQHAETGEDIPLDRLSEKDLEWIGATAAEQYAQRVADWNTEPWD